MNRKSLKSGSKQFLTTSVIISLVLTFLWGFLFFTSKDLAYAQTTSVGSEVSIYNIVYKNSFDSVNRAYEPKILTVKKGDAVYQLFTIKNDIREILSDYMIPIASNERVTFSTPYLMDGTIVKLITTEVVTELKEIEIPFSTEVTKTDEYMEGEKNVIQQGVLGVKTQRIVKYYEDGELIKSELVEENIKREPINAIIEEGTAKYAISEVDAKGYNCPYWYGVVDSGPYTDKEKSWLKFVMKCESGCNAESNKNPSYKGLFQWSPKWWSRQYSENIFDGHAQIKHTIEKYRAGAQTMWPACNSAYERTQ